MCERPFLRRFPLADNPNDAHASLNHNNCWTAVVDGQPLESARFLLHLRRARIKTDLEAASASYAPLPARGIRHERLGTSPSHSARSWLALIGRPRRYFRGLRPSSPGQPSARPKTLFLAKPNVASPERRFCTANRSPLRRCTSCCCRKCRRPSSRHREPPDRKDQCRDLARRAGGGGTASSGDGRTSQR